MHKTCLALITWPSANQVIRILSGDCIKLLIHNFWSTKSRDFNEIQPKWCSEKCIPDYRYLHSHLHMYPSTYTAQNKLVSICCCWESKVLKRASFVANIWMASLLFTSRRCLKQHRSKCTKIAKHGKYLCHLCIVLAFISNFCDASASFPNL